ncbi:MAG: WecB/TagA/CpsF family glycosyltransferase [Lachnospiraceae bacterium]|nr:WecB/TagA/CpsF family glycosyltransferase [Lachnospiraceae bacterium]
MARMQFMNTEVDNITMQEALDAIENLIGQKKNAYVVTPNVDHIIKLEHDKEFKEVYDNADLILVDGKPLLWFAKWYKTPIVEKISGSDLFPKVCEMAAKKNFTMFFFGAAEGVADKAAENLKKKYSGLQVVGTYSPPLGFEKKPEELQKAINLVRQASPDILIAALGSPKQEKFVYKYRDELQVPVSLGLGASIDFEAGNVKRAPKWMSNAGLEWFYRLLKEPKRMFKRYIIDDMKIFKLAVKYKK